MDTLAFKNVNGDFDHFGTLLGFLVSNTPTAKPLAGGSCQDLEGNACLSYFQNICLQKIFVTINVAEIYEIVLNTAS